MSIAKKINERLEEKSRVETTTTSILIERLKEQKESEKQESIKSDEFKYEFGLYGFDSGLIKKYQKEFKGKKLEEHYNGNIIKNKYGECFAILNKDVTKINISIPEKAKQKYFSELRIIDGIGEYYEKKLIDEGYKTLNDLVKHYRFGTITKEFQELTDKKNGLELFKWLERRYPKSHQLVFLVSSFYTLKDFIFIDIETLGLHGHPLFLIGIAYFDKQTIVIEQILARDMDEEAAVLAYLNEKLKKKKVIGSYNGKSFDIPVIKDRMGYYSVNGYFKHPHFDIYHFSKRAFQDKFIDFKLTSLENKIFNVVRKDHIPSFLVPDYYNAYLRTKNIGSLVPIIEHNNQDIISTVKIFGKIHELWG
jgi:uncharacterized protein YprB with RNaseH-like and TPR domain